MKIADIKVEGAQNYGDYVIVGLSGLSKADYHRAGDEITQACKRYWRHGLFSDVKLQQTRLKATKFG